VRIRNFGFSPTATAPRYCRCAFDCSRITGKHSHATSPSADDDSLTLDCPVCGGTMRVVERLAAAQLLLRSPPQRTGAPHQPSFPSSASDRASARTQIPCSTVEIAPLPISPTTARSLRATLPSSIHTSKWQFVIITASSSTHRAPPVHSKYHRLPCGRLPQVAVSEAPSQTACKLELFARALQIQH